MNHRHIDSFLLLLDTTGKLFEMILVRKLSNHLKTIRTLKNNQYRFRKRRSSIYAIKMLQTIIKDINAKGHVV